MTPEQIVAAIEQEARETAETAGHSEEDTEKFIKGILRAHLVKSLTYPRSYRSTLTILFKP